MHAALDASFSRQESPITTAAECSGGGGGNNAECRGDLISICKDRLMEKNLICFDSWHVDDGNDLKLKN